MIKMTGLELLIVPISVLCVFVGEGMSCSPTSLPANFQTYRPSFFKVRDCGQRPLHLDHRRRKRVTGGSDAEEGDWPWHVRLNADHKCSGVLIDSDWVATAAHCVYVKELRGLLRAENVTITAGTVQDGFGDDNRREGSQTRRVSNIYVHPGYPGHEKLIHHDFALLKLSEPFDIGPLVQTACIHMEDNAFQPGHSECYIAGWGRFYRSDTLNRPSSLQYSRVPLQTDENCTKYSASVSRYQLSLQTDEKFCAGVWSRDLVQGPCKGDSGGPLVCLDRNSRSWYVIGLVSHGKKCGEVGFYTKIYSMLGYIEGVISGNITDDDFECSDGRESISYERQCDGVVDCEDMSDEVHCDCSEHQFRCANGVCRLQSERCDAIDDCGDGSDENDCEYFLCKSMERNVSLTVVCDGEKDCPDWSDEYPSICACNESTHFKCPTGPCIPLSWRCDGQQDCSQGNEDEVNCTCREGYFTCNNTLCVPKQTVCDRKDDCGDQSDENNCGDSCIYCKPVGQCFLEEEISCNRTTFTNFCQDNDTDRIFECLNFS